MPRSRFRFSWPFRVRYAEVDCQMVVFNSHYLTYFDTAILEYFRAVGYDYMGRVERTGEDFHTVRTVVEYRRPIRFDEDIEVHVRTSRLGRSSLTFALEIHGRDREDLRAEGEVVWVNTDQASHGSAPIPEALAGTLRAFDGTDTAAQR